MILRNALKMKNKINYLILTIVKIYSNFSTLCDRLFYRNKSFNQNFDSKGFEVVKIEKLNLENYDTRLIKSNKYLEKIIFNHNELLKMIKHIFIDNSLADIITKKSGYCYSIDYFTAYITFHIDKSDQSSGWYANHWHTDKPFSKDMMKVIVPLESIGEKHGAMEILSDKKIKFKATLNKREIFMFYPNRCLHRAGNPSENFVRKQMMFQLNPAKNWKLNRQIFQRQEKAEPKFPHIKYLFDDKILLNNI